VDDRRDALTGNSGKITEISPDSPKDAFAEVIHRRFSMSQIAVLANDAGSTAVQHSTQFVITLIQVAVIAI